MESAGGKMSGKVCMVTGGASGIGRATALGLARLGARVVTVDRERGAAGNGHDSVDLMTADLSSQKAVRRLAVDFKRAYGRLDVLINNAGVLLRRRAVTEDGVEATFAVNHLAPFLLTNLLLDTLKASAPARVVNVACEGHRRGRLDLDDLQLEKGYSAVRAYNRSKLANVLFTCELARRLEGTGVTANCLHPGMVRTGLFKKAPMAHRALFALFSPLFQSPERGAETSIYLASSAEIEGVSGRYFIRKAPVRPSEASSDRRLAGRVWKASAELVGLG